MNRLRTPRFIVPLSALVLTFACGSSDDDPAGGTGGTGGALGTGGAAATGGSGTTGGTTASGGVSGAGGGPLGSGGVSTGGGVTTGGAFSSGGATSGGSSGTGSAPATGGGTASGGAATTGGASGTGGGTGQVGKFSFFVTSQKAMVRESNNPQGFGGDLTFGEAGQGAGLRGADKLCAKIAETSMPGAGTKTWRAFLSARSAGPSNAQVNAIDRIGAGPWYDRLGRLVAQNLTDIRNTRPVGADATIINDLPNEDGVPNHKPDVTQAAVDNHDVLTGSTTTGTLYGSGMGPTCNDWTSNVGSTGKPRVGHSWPRMGGSGFPGGGGPGGMDNWMSALDEAGCAPGINIVEMGPPNPQNPTVGSGGGYGGIYCFALTP
jgi:hypothetical protein